MSYVPSSPLFREILVEGGKLDASFLCGLEGRSGIPQTEGCWLCVSSSDE
jgi:hypothetical protein